MISKAEARFVRTSSSKARLVVDLIRKKTLEEAYFILDNANQRASMLIKKVLDSAFANANHNKQDKFLAKDLYILVMKAEGGPMIKRFRAATMGRAAPIRHRTAHLYVELEKVPGAEPKAKAVKAKKEKKLQAVK